MQRRVWTAGLVIAAAGIFAGGYAAGQSTGLKLFEEKIAEADIKLRSQRGEDMWAGAALSTDLYAQAAGSQQHTDKIVQQALVGHYGRDNYAAVKMQALQIAQNQHLIEQNDEIIKHLDKIAHNTNR